MSTGAFVFRMSAQVSLDEGLRAKELICGWSDFPKFREETATWDVFRDSIAREFRWGTRAAAQNAGSIWRFIKVMNVGDYVVVPDTQSFYVGRITGEARFEEAFVSSDTAHRRSVDWLNSGKPIHKRFASSALKSRLKARQTCVDATDLIPEIERVLQEHLDGVAQDFNSDLRSHMIESVLGEILHGKMGNESFEALVLEYLRKSGADSVVRRRGKTDQGADVVATFRIGGVTEIRLAVQAKYFRPSPPVEPWVVDQLVGGMQAEKADVGWIVTSGTVPETVLRRIEELEREGTWIEVIDGEQFAGMIVEIGVSPLYVKRV